MYVYVYAYAYMRDGTLAGTNFSPGLSMCSVTDSWKNPPEGTRVGSEGVFSTATVGTVAPMLSIRLTNSCLRSPGED